MLYYFKLKTALTCIERPIGPLLPAQTATIEIWIEFDANLLAHLIDGDDIRPFRFRPGCKIEIVLEFEILDKIFPLLDKMKAEPIYSIVVLIPFKEIIEPETVHEYHLTFYEEQIRPKFLTVYPVLYFTV